MAIKRKFPPRVATVYCSGGCRAKKDEDGGKIVQRGTHDELLATCDEYRSIYESQTKNQAQPEELAAAEQAAESSTAEPSETVTVTVTMPTADTSAADANAADTKEGEAR